MKIIRSPPFVVIENLPKDIVTTILAFLPLRDAVRTSILSKKWRYRWTNLVKLVFDDTMCPESTENRQSGKNKLVLAIYQVLLLHQGPVLEFSLSTSELDNCSVIDQVILFLSRTGVEKFTLHIGSGKHYKLPSSFFSCPRLTHLNLRSCVVEPPPTFQGFNQLISLKFDEVVIAADLFGRFISSCPLLERLTLTGSDCYHYFEIREFLDLRKCICFEFAPLLSNVSVALKQPVLKEYLEEEETFNFIKLFGGLPLLQNLRMDYYLIKSLAAGGVPKKLPTNLAHLKILEFSLICFSELDEVSCALCLIRSSPNLQKLLIQMFEAKDAAPILEFLQAQDYSDVILDRLQIVKVKHISGMRAELEFIKFLLAKTPRLETLLIKPKSENANDKLKMLQMLTRFRRAWKETTATRLGNLNNAFLERFCFH